MEETINTVNTEASYKELYFDLEKKYKELEEERDYWKEQYVKTGQNNYPCRDKGSPERWQARILQAFARWQYPCWSYFQAWQQTHHRPCGKCSGPSEDS